MSAKVVAIIGSPRNGRTLGIVKQFEQCLKKLGNIDFEYVFLKDVDLKACRGCGACLEKGEEYCPLKDERTDIFMKMMQADGVIFASPVYSLQVTALLKNLLDRLAYVFHRPCFFHKTFMPIVTQGVYGYEGVLKYLAEVARFWGFKTCPGLGLTVAWEKPLPAEQQKYDLETAKAAQRFFSYLTSNTDSIPSLKEVVIFRSVRAVHSIEAGLARDYRYYKEQGWLEADYFYPTRISWYKQIIGRWVEKQTIKQALKAKRAL
ncbi:2-amino-4-deoxychorismate dehydrogenase [Sporotomaculum syntrophicum]|uniref:2-amino-4-deoxychorismate dehydrogenase n=1 Tax=Sporotomaculum syntrophicum TaxID=182264 RepID=A0A9D2WRU5_9FIRM|nr:NAD(P)H-dependent oxidoreductase [Sporotomaculum syntrophicum]KAF1086198.1 2-amino-4-deoxychorismate dehydrogenase [Sporotomaculum syntrophicum]